MLPKAKEWRRWSALDKATYLAQLLAPISLIIGSIFSYLSWREAHAAQEVQQRLFIAENGPNIEIDTINLTPSDGGKVVALTMKNVGGSNSHGLCFQFYADYVKPIDSSPCDDKDPFSNILIRPGSTTTYLMPVWVLRRGGALDFDPTTVNVQAPGKAIEPCAGPSAVVLVTYSYTDVLGHDQGGIEQFRLCGASAATASLAG